MTQAAIAFIGDPHGRWADICQQIRRQLERGIEIQAIVPVGDMELEQPLDKELAEFLDKGIAVHWIYGNHDSNETHWYDHLFESKLKHNNFHASIADIGGTCLAGLEGVFRGVVCPPEKWPVFRERILAYS